MSSKIGNFRFGSRKCGDRDDTPIATPKPTPIPTPDPTTQTPTPVIPTPTPAPATPPPPPAGSSGADGSLSAIPTLPPTINITVDPFTARCEDYGLIRLRWRAPAGSAVQTLRLVSNTSGYAVDENDGVILYDGPPSIAEFEDRTVQPGQEYYYTIFCKQPDNTPLLLTSSLYPDPSLMPGAGGVGYIPVSKTREVAVIDTNIDPAQGNVFMKYLPRVYTSSEQDVVGVTDTGSQLARFLQVFAFQVDKYKTSIQNLMPFTDAVHVQGPMVGPLARMLGMSLEEGLGIRQSRILARDATLIYQQKGTTSGVGAYAKALTGLGAKVTPGYNIMANTVDSSFTLAGKAQMGRWSAAGNCTVDTTGNQANVNVPPLPTFPAVLLPGGLSTSAGAALAVTCTTAGTVKVRHAGTAGTGYGIAVEPGATYAVRASVQAKTTGRSATLGVEWRTASGTLLATSTQTSGTTDGNTYQDITYTVVAPANAVFANLLVSWASAALNEVHFLDSVQFEKLSLPVPDGDFELDENANPWTLVTPSAPTQNLVTNATFESDTAGWSSPAGFDVAPLSKNSSTYRSGTSSLQITWPNSTIATGGVQYTATNLNAGQRYQFSLWSYVPSGSPRIRVGEMLGNGTNYTYQTRDTGTTKDSWVRLSFTFTAASTMYLGVQLDEDSTAGQTAYVDDVSLVNLDYPFGNQMSFDSTVKQSGRQSLKLQGFLTGQDTYAFQNVPVVPGQSYNVTASANVPIFNAGALGTRGLYITDGAQTSNAGTPGTSKTFTKVQPPQTGCYSGFYTPTSGAGNDRKHDLYATVQQETTFATSFDIVPFFVDFSNAVGTDSNSWPTTNMKAVYDGGSVSSTSGSGTITGGRVPLIRWESALYTTQNNGVAASGSATVTGGSAQSAYTYAQILAGSLDTYINARAAAVAAWGKPIMISFDHEADTFNSLATVSSARRQAAAGSAATTAFADAFRYIKAKFDAAGCTNVTWVYSLSGQTGSNISATALNEADYDWIGLDPYVKTNSTTVAARLQSYVTRLDNGEAGTGGQTKPIILPEWGVDNTYGSRTQAFSQMVTALQSGTLSRVKAMCYYNGGVDALDTVSTPATMGLIVPAFYDPYQKNANDSWERMIRNPQGISWIIANDSNGRMADRHADPAYPSAIARARAAGIKIMYYVETHRASKSLADVKADMDGWRRCYGAPDGWFFDQASTHASDISYYQSLYTYGGGGAGGKTIMINPGDTPDQAYMTGSGIFDIIGVAEDTAYEVRNWPWPSWQNTYSRSRMAVFTYRSRNVTSDFNYIQSKNIGWVYIGDDSVFDRLPTFWSTEQQLAATTVSDVPGFKSMLSSSYLTLSVSVVTVTTIISPTVVGQYTTITSTTNGWVQHLVNITPQTSKLQIRLYSPNGTVYWDDVGMARTSPSPFADARRAEVLLFADRVNFCVNPNFESGTTGWSPTPTAPGSSLTGYSSSTALAVDTTTYYAGSQALKVTHPTAAKSGVTTVLTDLTPGQVYTASLRALVPAGGPIVSLEHDAAGFFLSGATAVSAVASVTIGSSGRQIGLTINESPNVAEYAYPELPGIFTTLTATFVATSNVHTLGVYAASTTSGQVFYVDQVMVEASPTLNEYFDGNVLGLDYLWEGVANQSRSHYVRHVNVRSKRLATRLPSYLPAAVPYAVRLAWPGA